MANKKLSFVIGVHCHQPVGNFGWVIEEAYEKSYRPFIEFLGQNATIKAAAHFSGPLLEWIEANRPEFFRLVQRLVTDGRLEIIGGGFYEPILLTIPNIDRIEQIETMNVYAEQKLGMHPNGIWLTERIWEPSLPGTLREAGAEFTFTDDSHFLQVGVPAEKVRGYFVTEDEGNSCAIFPIDQTLRYAIPFKDPQVAIDYLKRRYDSGDTTLCTLFDDGEKFGLWPGTFKLLYQEGWLKHFCDLIAANSDWLETVTPTEYLRNHPPEGLIYLPTASYFEMGVWSLAPKHNLKLEALRKRMKNELGENTETFLKGAFFRNFFTRYPESNHMHKRMLEVSRKVHLSTLEGQPREEAKRELFMAQCNCGYWHGIFGGLYLPHLREAIYEHLIRAERMADERTLWTECFDLDFNGQDEIRLANDLLWALISPTDGGSVLELDVVKPATNLVNTLARRHEAYHEPADLSLHSEDGGSIHDIPKELTPDQRDLLVYDPLRLTCFREYLFPYSENLSEKSLAYLKPRSTGGLETLAYSHEILESPSDVQLDLSAETILETGPRLSIRKRYSIERHNPVLSCSYEIGIVEGEPFEGVFAVNFNLLVASALGIREPFSIDGETLVDHPLLKPGHRQDIFQFGVRDPHRRIQATIRQDKPFEAIWYPIETFSQSESGFDRNYQASSIWATRPIRLETGEKTQFVIRLMIEETI